MGEHNLERQPCSHGTIVESATNSFCAHQLLVQMLDKLQLARVEPAVWEFITT